MRLVSIEHRHLYKLKNDNIVSPSPTVGHGKLTKYTYMTLTYYDTFLDNFSHNLKKR